MDTLKRLAEGTLDTTSTVLYTVPTGTKTVVTEIILANKTASAVSGTIQIGNAQIVPAKSIPANDALVIPTHTIMEAGETITGLAGAATSIDYRISGVEVA